MKTITRTGFWSDVCVLPSGRFAHVVSDRGAVAAYEGVEQTPPLWRQTLATDMLRFLRCASAPDGSIAAIGQAADGRGWLVRAGSAQMLDVAAGVNPVAIRHDGQRWIAYTMVAPDRCREIRLDGGARDIQVPAGASGIREVRPDGTLAFGDGSGPGVAGYSFDDYCRSAGMICGSAGGRIGVLLEAGPHYFSLTPGTVHLGVRGARNGTRLGVSAMTDTGAFFAEIDQPYPPHESPAQPAGAQPSVPVATTPAAVETLLPNPIPGKVSFQTVSGRFVCADLGTSDRRLVCDRERIGGWETFELMPAGSGRVWLKADNGRFVTAEDGGGRELVANRTSPPAAWEEFQIALIGDDSVAIKTVNGRYVSADSGGPGVLRAAATSVGPAETFKPSRPLARSFHPGSIQGRLRIDGRAFVNDAGTFRPIFTSGLALLARSSDEMRAFLDWAARTGFNGIRVFAGKLGWASQSVAQAKARLPELLNEAAARGLYVEVTAITDSRDGGYDPADHFRAIARIAEQGTNAILEVANEPYHGTQADAIHSAETLLALGRQSSLPFALGAAQDDESVEMGGGSFVTAHLDRGRDKWNQVRRVRELAVLGDTTRKPVVNNEPIGAAESSQPGRRESDPAFFFCMGDLRLAAGGLGLRTLRRLLGRANLGIGVVFRTGGDGLPVDRLLLRLDRLAEAAAVCHHRGLQGRKVQAQIVRHVHRRDELSQVPEACRGAVQIGSRRQPRLQLGGQVRVLLQLLLDRRQRSASRRGR